MKILIDIGHPAHVHLFKNVAWILQRTGHEILFTCREKEFEIQLLQQYNFAYKSFGKKYNSRIGKLVGLMEFDIKEALTGLKFKPDILLSHGSIYAAHAAFLLSKPHIALEDTGNKEQVRLYMPFTKSVITSNVFPYDYGNKQIRINSHHELAYLHPNYFVPDPLFLNRIGLDKNDRYVILRFVAWNASHDVGQKGLGISEKQDIVKRLARNFRVMISSEGSLPVDMEPYRVSFAPHDIHNALYFADMFIGEGTTMAMEAAILGTPSVYCNTLQYNNVADMEKYGLLFNYSFDNNIGDSIINLSVKKDLKLTLVQARNKMLEEKVDLTRFLVWFIENYPVSKNMVLANENYQ